MKNTIFLSILVFIFFLSCSKDDGNSDLIIGDWREVRRCYIDSDDNNSIECHDITSSCNLVFQSNNNYYSYSEENSTRWTIKGKYNRVSGDSIVLTSLKHVPYWAVFNPDGTFTFRFKFNGESGVYEIEKLTEDELILRYLSSEINENSIRHYIRMK